MLFNTRDYKEPFKKDGECENPQVIVYLSSNPFLLKGFLICTMTKYYRVRTGYGEENSFTITGKELPFALWAFINKDSDLITKYGAVRGEKIIDILPDHVASMGWNKGYTPNAEDWREINRELGKGLEDLMDEVKTMIANSNGNRALFTQMVNEKIGILSDNQKRIS